MRRRSPVVLGAALALALLACGDEPDTTPEAEAWCADAVQLDTAVDARRATPEQQRAVVEATVAIARRMAAEAPADVADAQQVVTAAWERLAAESRTAPAGAPVPLDQLEQDPAYRDAIDALEAWAGESCGTG